MGYFEKHRITLPKELIEKLTYDEEYSNLLREDLRVQFNFKRVKADDKLKELRRGYENMASINLSFAEMGLLSDINSLEDYEGTLSSPNSEKINMEQGSF